MALRGTLVVELSDHLLRIGAQAVVADLEVLFYAAAPPAARAVKWWLCGVNQDRFELIQDNVDRWVGGIAEGGEIPPLQHAASSKPRESIPTSAEMVFRMLRESLQQALLAGRLSDVDKSVIPIEDVNATLVGEIHRVFTLLSLSVSEQHATLPWATTAMNIIPLPEEAVAADQAFVHAHGYSPLTSNAYVEHWW